MKRIVELLPDFQLTIFIISITALLAACMGGCTEVSEPQWATIIRVDEGSGEEQTYVRFEDGEVRARHGNWGEVGDTLRACKKEDVNGQRILWTGLPVHLVVSELQEAEVTPEEQARELYVAAMTVQDQPLEAPAPRWIYLVGAYVGSLLVASTISFRIGRDH